MKQTSEELILAVDQGTTSTRCILFNAYAEPVSSSQKEFKQIYPKPGWVEHDPEEIWETVKITASQCMKNAGVKPSDIKAVGITNQRETGVFWSKTRKQAVSNSIVWQCRRSADICEEVKEKGYGDEIRRRTGLIVDPYFSASKITWKLRQRDEASVAAREGDLRFGTIDSWLIYRMSGFRDHITDVSNASRTMLFNIDSLDWDDMLLDVFGIQKELLPEVRDSSGNISKTDPDAFLGIKAPISGVAGDQQSALFGQACFNKGSSKNTYGTGSFLLTNIGKKPIFSDKGILTTVAWRMEDVTSYALEGSIFITGAAINWLKDGLGIISRASEIEGLANSVEDTEGLFFVPAMVGLGAPYWDPHARGLIIGITRGTQKAHLARAVIESMAFQTRDVLDLMHSESGMKAEEMKADGGASVMESLLQFQSDLCGIPVIRPAVSETTALGAALLAGLGAGIWKNLHEISDIWKTGFRAEPDRSKMSVMESKYSAWKKAVERCRQWAAVVE